MPGRADYFLKLTTIIICFALTNCYTPPQDYKVDSTTEIAKPQEVVWKKAVEYFAVNNLPIKTIDKNSGIIAGEKPADAKLVDCGNANATPVLEKDDAEKPKIEFNIFIKADGTKTIVSIHENIGKSKAFKPMQGDVDIECKSKGVFEKELLDYIKS